MKFRSASLLLISREPRIQDEIRPHLSEGAALVQVKAFSSALQALKHLKAELILLDATVPGYERAEQVRLLLDLSPESAIILVRDPARTQDSDSEILSALEAGAQDAIELMELGQSETARRLMRARARASACDSIRRNRQSASQHTARMASIGVLTARIAHELKQPLTFLEHSVSEALREIDVLMTQSGKNPGLHAQAKELQTRLRRMQSVERDTWRLVRELGAFSRRIEEPIGTMRPGDAIDSALLLTSAEIRSRARLERQIEPAPSVRISPSRLKQALVNLLINAAQALPENRPSENRIRISLRGTDRGWAQIEVADSGPGIAPELQNRIFEPFFTTKSKAEGTGLGLAIAREIIEQAGGTLELDSSPGQGAIFRILLPPADGACAAPVVLARKPTLLLIDDGEIRQTELAQVFSREFEIVSVHDADEAVEMIRQGLVQIHAVLCELNSGTYSGARLYQRAVNANPDLRSAFIFMRGDASDPESLHFANQACCVVLEKPFTAEYLNEAVSLVIQKRIGKL